MTEHGDYAVSAEQAVIYVTLNGIFNDVASQKVRLRVEAIINDMKGANFCMLYNMLNYEGSTREAHQIANQHFKWLETQNCLARANVASNAALIHISRNEQASLRESNTPAKIFKTEVDAKAWLQSVLQQ
ncbi:hypothetical protein [Paraglaciecola sp.]|uniref:hypothetical protein n=1 Tax=Paraglaciecola sp. TaxID=1920173 RepID=UPI003EF6E027